MPEHNPISALILAAGHSERMGRDKASLPYGNGLTFAGQLIAAYAQAGCHPVTMVVNERFDSTIHDLSKVRFILNNQVERGRSFSIWLGLQNIPAGRPCFIQNIDNPFAEAALLRKMSDMLKPDLVVVPVYDGAGGHPILLGSKVVDELRKKSDIPNLKEALKEFERIEVISSDDRIHLNINTPESYRKFVKPE
ncbi:MAG: nucleotidyltransferase family protein [Bacteroidales bacterium]